MIRTIFGVAVLSLTVMASGAGRFASGPLELKVDPVKVTEPGQYKLLAVTDKQTDAAALYKKAVQALPSGRVQDQQVRAWLKLPMDLMNDQAFGYQHTPTRAVLQTEVPEGGDTGDVVRYQVVVKK